VSVGKIECGKKPKGKYTKGGTIVEMNGEDERGGGWGHLLWQLQIVGVTNTVMRLPKLKSISEEATLNVSPSVCCPIDMQLTKGFKTKSVNN